MIPWLLSATVWIIVLSDPCQVISHMNFSTTLLLSDYEFSKWLSDVED